MPRPLRITEPGYYHVINRGVERRIVFQDEEDYDIFIKIIKDITKEYKIKLHAYCLMNNHYHLLIQTTKTNISDALRYLNSTYSFLFNKKYHRSGHLWQGRFFSNYLYDDEHFWIIAKYIERNPIKANIVKDVKHYKYQSLFQYLYNYKHFDMLQDSKILQMSKDDYLGFINSEMSEEYLQKVYTEPKKIVRDDDIVILTKRLEDFFENDRDINRIKNIKKAYDYGYSKSDIANFLNMSRSTISRYL